MKDGLDYIKVGPETRKRTEDVGRNYARREQENRGERGGIISLEEYKAAKNGNRTKNYEAPKQTRQEAQRKNRNNRKNKRMTPKNKKILALITTGALAVGIMAIGVSCAGKSEAPKESNKSQIELQIPITTSTKELLQNFKEGYVARYNKEHEQEGKSIKSADSITIMREAWNKEIGEDNLIDPVTKDLNKRYEIQNAYVVRDKETKQVIEVCKEPAHGSYDTQAGTIGACSQSFEAYLLYSDAKNYSENGNKIQELNDKCIEQFNKDFEQKIEKKYREAIIDRDSGRDD